MSFIECGGSVHFYERGSNVGTADQPTLVFVNALGTDHRIWNDVIAQLPEGLPWLRYDMRGHGASETGAAPYRVSGLSEDLAELLDRLDISSAVLCGLSVGGLVAQQFALSRPARLRALVLCG